ncbi:hypothetical protein H0H87_004857 [Tephrocybe sp. NHM501043]|nr:hypothetical protein H0H87_004857 [Tephrocybe sp. NHM501043]
MEASPVVASSFTPHSGKSSVEEPERRPESYCQEPTTLHPRLSTISSQVVNQSVGSSLRSTSIARSVIETPRHLEAPTESGTALQIPGGTFFSADVHNAILPMYQSPTIPEKQSPGCLPIGRNSWVSLKRNFLYIVFTALRKLYHVTFLGIPVFYRHRVQRIFKEVRLSADELMGKIIARLADDQARLESRNQPLSPAAYFVRSEEPEIRNLMTLWEAFVDLSIREWKTTNLEGERTGNHIFWNTWVLLAMPVTWLSWSMILYVVGIMAFVWRAGSGSPPRIEIGLVSRIAITCLLLVGVVYLVIIMITLNEYGDRMDGKWREKVREVAAQRNIQLRPSFQSFNVHVDPPRV